MNRVLCKVHGDSKVYVTKQYHVTSEMGSMMGNIAPAQDLEGDSVCDTKSESWETMLRVREKVWDSRIVTYSFFVSTEISRSWTKSSRSTALCLTTHVSSVIGMVGVVL